MQVHSGVHLQRGFGYHHDCLDFAACIARTLSRAEMYSVLVLEEVEQETANDSKICYV